MIEISIEQIDRINKLLSGVQNGPQRVLHNAVNRGLNKAKTQAAKEASAIFVLSQSQIKSYAKINQKNASPGNNIIGQISFSGNMIPIYKFKVSGKGGKGSSVKVHVKRGGGGTLLHAFIRNLGHGTNVLERRTSQRNSSETIFGPSAAHMIGHAEVVPQIEEEVQEVVNKRIEHEIERLLNGINV